MLYVGGGVIKADASDELFRWPNSPGIPVVTTLMARGAFPDGHKQHLGMPGMHGTVAAVGALQRADLLIAIGTRFDDRVTGKLSSFAPDAKIIHADIDPAEIGKNKPVDIPIVGDARAIIVALTDAIQAAVRTVSATSDYSDWWKTVDHWTQHLPARLRRSPTTAPCRRST